ncbi:ribonuclease H-like domain-containing protein [Tanacetum coccineum]
MAHIHLNPTWALLLPTVQHGESISHPSTHYSGQQHLGYVYLQSGLGHYCPSPAQPASYMTHPQANLVSSVPIQPAQCHPAAKYQSQQAHPYSSSLRSNDDFYKNQIGTWILGVCSSRREQVIETVYNASYTGFVDFRPTRLCVSFAALLCKGVKLSSLGDGFSADLCLLHALILRSTFYAFEAYFGYVRGTIDHGLQLYVSSTSQLTAYTDADWAGCPVTRRSTSGYCVFLGDNLLSWSAKRQLTLSRSSAEAEYRGAAFVVLHFPSDFSMKLFFTKGLPQLLFLEFPSAWTSEDFPLT